MIDKRVLRARMRAARDGFAGGALLVPNGFLARLRPGVIVASYEPVGGEVDPRPLTDAAVATGCCIALPHVVDRATPLRFLAAGAALYPGPFGLRQPHPDAAAVAPDIVLAPLIAFDRAGNRLGQGAGHYDRAFADHPDAWRVGVAWSVQEVNALPTDAWDVPLHAIVTETEWIEPMAMKP